jgi:hypothetical protein
MSMNIQRETKLPPLIQQHIEPPSSENKELAQSSASLSRITGVFLLLVVVGLLVPDAILSAIGIIDAPAAKSPSSSVPSSWLKGP